MDRLKDRVALITGAGRGIGKGIAKRFAEEGARVCLADVNGEALQNTEKEWKVYGWEVMTCVMDVTDRSQVENAVDTLVQEWGRLDVLVNNAGMIRDNLLFKMTDDEWRQVLDVHLTGSFLCSRAVQKQMVKQQYGRIINLSSTSALGNRGQANYSAVKAGLQGFTKTLAIELGKFGITCNAIAPGWIDTDMTRATAARIGIDFDRFVEAAQKEIPVERIGKPEDIAHAALFFASEESSFVNGQVLYVAGGPKT